MSLSGQAEMMSGAGAQESTFNAALVYVQTVRGRFPDNKQKYYDFLDVMKDLTYQRIDRAGAIERVEELFKEHRDLILGFSNFFKGHEITLPIEDDHPSNHPGLSSLPEHFDNQCSL